MSGIAMAYKIHSIDARVMSEKEGIYRLNIDILDLGIYVKNATIRHSKKNDNWWLQPPKRHISKNQYRAPVEFDTHTSLWEEMYEASVNALNDWRRDENL